MRNNHFSFLVHSTHIYLPMKLEQTECSETSVCKLQTPGYYPKESIQQEMYIISVKPRKFHLGRPWHRISLKCLIESYQFSRCLVRGIYTEGICLVLCNDDGIVYTSLSTFVATMFPLVFANQPKALVCNEGCHSIITTKTTGKKPVEAWMGHRELSWKRYY